MADLLRQLTATVSGVPGIIIQVLIIPPVVYALEGAVTLTDILESAKEQLHNNNFSIVIVGENDVLYFSRNTALHHFWKFLTVEMML